MTRNERFAAFTAAARDREPVIFVHGAGTGDAFVDSGYRICGLEECVWDALHNAGFERIVFYSPTQKVYFRDDESLRAVRPDGPARPGAAQAQSQVPPGQLQTPVPAGQPRRMRAGFRGPLRDQVIIGPRAAGAAGGAVAPGAVPAAGGTAPVASPLPRPDTGPADQPGAVRRVLAAIPGVSALTEPHSIQVLRALLRPGTPPTAVVFVHAEEALRHTAEDRSFADLFASNFVQYERDRPHTCVLLLRSASLQEAQAYLERLSTVPSLANSARLAADRAERGENPGLIGMPDDEELARLVHCVRLRRGLKIANWGGLPQTVRAMSSQQHTARAWEGRLLDLVARGLPLDAKVLLDEKWVKSVAEGPGGVWERFDGLRGLDSVKAHVRGYYWKVLADVARRANGPDRAEPGSYHLVFTGNPGTGKTTVAKLIGEMYRDLGVLRRGHVRSVHGSDLISQYVGATSGQVNGIIDEALDGVLFIDEAYELSDQGDQYGRDAITTLLHRMEDDRDRLVVIVAGYPDKMREFLDSNPGLKSRFPEDNRIEFPDYPADLLLEILLDQLRALDIPLSEDLPGVLGRVVNGMYRTRSKKSWGNAREMRVAADAIHTRWANRVRRRLTEPAVPADLPDRLSRFLDPEIPEMAELLGELDAMIGLDPVKEEIRRLVIRLQRNQRRGKEGVEVIVPHMVFAGPPGTGKTTVARLMGRIFRVLGLLAEGDQDPVEVGRSGLVAGYVGQTALKTMRAFDDAEGRVLFIDEAYSLSRGQDGGADFGAEAIDVIVQESWNRRGQVCVIVAGYEGPMADFINSNAGLARRFPVTVRFPAYTTGELVEILKGMAAARQNCTLTDGAEKKAAAWFDARRAKDGESFGNAGAAGILLDLMEARNGARLEGTADIAAYDVFTAQDVPDV